MKRLCVFLLLFGFTKILTAQIFLGDSTLLLDRGNTQSYILVNGLSHKHLNPSYGLKEICVSIQHPFSGALAIYLLSPQGVTIELSSGNGTGSDYTSTCFNQSASILISSGSSPFTGSFVPEQNIGNINNGDTSEGLWTLIVTDYFEGDTGKLLSWSLLFDTLAPAPSSTPPGPCNEYSPGSCVCEDGSNNCILYPDIIVSTHMLQDTFWQKEIPGTFYLTNSTANIGYGPIEIFGTGRWFCGDSLVDGNVLCSDSTYSRQEVVQRLYKKTSFGFFDYVDSTVGYMQFHSALGHRHLHVDSWVQNSIRLKGISGNPLDWPILAMGNKVSFCVYDHLECNTSFKSCEYNGTVHRYVDLPNAGLGSGYNSCGDHLQGMSVGYSDIYDFNIEGQDVPVDTLCNGKYYLVAQFDPDNLFKERNRSNNLSVVPMRLEKQLDCCKSRFKVDTLNLATGHYQLIDLSIPIPEKWEWNINGSVDTLQFPEFYAAADDTVFISLKTENDLSCSDSSFAHFYTGTTGVNPLQKSELKADIFPNPNNGFFNIHFTEAIPLHTKITIYDALSHKLLQDIIEPTAFIGLSKSYQIVGSGVYFVKIENKENYLVKKLVVNY